MSEYALYDKIDATVKCMHDLIDHGGSRKTKKTAWMLIHTVLCFWLGQSYVGVEKSENLKNKYQMFYETLYEFLLYLRDSSSKKEKQIAERALFQGILYRYLGHNSFEDDIKKCEKVIPKYDGIYVSWSKIPYNDYIKSKLYGQITYLSCDTKDLFGIDLSAFGFEVGNAVDVVFPTFEDHIIAVDYLPLGIYNTSVEEKIP